MTLAQIIAAYEAKLTLKIAQMPAAGVLTPRGHAALALYRFTSVLRTLDAADRAYIIGVLAEELGAAPAGLAQPVTA
jgi:hypothetical protein